MRSFLNCTPNQTGENQWRNWLRHCATRRIVAGSIPDGVIRIIHRDTPSDRTTALGSIKSETEISTKNTSQMVKAGGE